MGDSGGVQNEREGWRLERGLCGAARRDSIRFYKNAVSVRENLCKSQMQMVGSQFALSALIQNLIFKNHTNYLWSNKNIAKKQY